MTVSIVQIVALILGFLSFVMYWISPEVLDQIKWLIWMCIMTVVIVGENILIHMYSGEEDDDDYQG